VSRIAILAYHAIDDDESVLSVSPSAFSEHMRILRDLPVRVVALADVIRPPGHDRDEDDLVAITFDDGFQSVQRHAFPVLQRHGFPATVFLVTDYCGRSNAWPGQPGWVRPAPLLGWPAIREMAAGGVAFGSHTRTHPDLTLMRPTDAHEELAVSKKVIEDETGRSVETLAYPYGTHDRRVRELARRHYSLACSADLGYVDPGDDALALPRLDMYYVRRPAMLKALLSQRLETYIAMRRWLRRVRRALSSAKSGAISKTTREAMQA
jgi:peptidoglycan/xylan/chitin deacetylase (PgdA/CDA1 family)